MEEESGTGCRAVERNPIFLQSQWIRACSQNLMCRIVHILPPAVAKSGRPNAHTSSSTAADKPHCENAQIQNKH